VAGYCLVADTLSRLVLRLRRCCPVLRAVISLMDGISYCYRSDKLSSVFIKTGRSCGKSDLIPTSLCACAKVELGIGITCEETFGCSIALGIILKYVCSIMFVLSGLPWLWEAQEGSGASLHRKRVGSVSRTL
jgi:hypothetical protein